MSNVAERLRRVLLGAALVGLLGLGPAVAAADPVVGSPAHAPGLDRAYTGRLDPSAGQPFAYYRFAYPGGIAVSIDLLVEPGGPGAVGDVGFRVYGPRAGKVYLQRRAVSGITPSASGKLVSADPGVYLVQVYGTGGPVDFTVWASGVPAALVPAGPDLGAPVPGVVVAGPAVAPPGTSPPRGPIAQQAGVPDQGVALTDVASGQLAAGTGGHFAYYKLGYPGGAVLSINAHVTSGDPSVLRAVGFKVYGPTAGKVYAQSSAQPGLIPNLSADLRSAEPGVYLVQVYNYHPTASVGFEIWATGLPLAAAPTVTPAAEAPATPVPPATSVGPPPLAPPVVVPPLATPTVAPTRAAP